VAAYYYLWYDESAGQWQKGYLRGRLDAPQRPALGEYDSRDPAVIAQHYRWAQRYGVDVFLTSWWGPHGYDDVTLRDHVLTSAARGPTRFAIFYESGARLPVANHRIPLDDAAIDGMVADFDYLARTYLRHPAYYRIGQRPFVVLYGSKVYRGKVAEAIRAVREHVRIAHGLELFLVGDEIDWDLGPSHARIGLFDAITPYTLYSRTQPSGWPSQTGFLQAIDSRLQQFRRVAAMKGVALVPGALAGFNDRGVRGEDGHYVLPHELDAAHERSYSLFSSFLELAGRYVDPKLRLLTVTSWNEWNEDTQIEPTAGAGPSSGPGDLTGGYTYHSYGFALLERLAAFKRRWPAASHAGQRAPCRHLRRSWGCGPPYSLTR
jgi:glycoprotein endo-alpha-1,2-mannosidase